MQQRAIDNPRIDVRWNTEVADVLGDENVEGLRLRDTLTGREWTEPSEGLFIAIGYRPNTEVFRDWLAVDDGGLPGGRRARPSSAIDGVFIAGDVHDHHYRQAVTAAADGCKAAIDAERWLEAHAPTQAATWPSPGARTRKGPRSCGVHDHRASYRSMPATRHGRMRTAAMAASVAAHPVVGFRSPCAQPGRVGATGHEDDHGP